MPLQKIFQLMICEDLMARIETNNRKQCPIADREENVLRYLEEMMCLKKNKYETEENQ